MKYFFALLILFANMLLVSASTPAMPTFPAKYQTWINHQRFENEIIHFDFHNYETSFTPQVCGFKPKTCYGSWYGYKISKYIVSHRDLLDASVPFCLSFIKTSSFKKKKILRDSIQTFELVYDEKILSLEDSLSVSIFNTDKRSKYYSIDLLGYIGKETFVEISKAKKLVLQFKVDGVAYKFDLQIPVVYEDTFDVGKLNASVLQE